MTYSPLWACAGGVKVLNPFIGFSCVWKLVSIHSIVRPLKIFITEIIETVFCSIIDGFSVSSYILNLHISQTAIQKWSLREWKFQTLEFIWSSILVLTYKVNGEFSGLYVEAMTKEIASLIHQNSSMSVPTNEANNVIISTRPYSSSDLQMELEASSRLVSVWEGMYIKKA